MCKKWEVRRFVKNWKIKQKREYHKAFRFTLWRLFQNVTAFKDYNATRLGRHNLDKAPKSGFLGALVCILQSSAPRSSNANVTVMPTAEIMPMNVTVSVGSSVRNAAKGSLCSSRLNARHKKSASTLLVIRNLFYKLYRYLCISSLSTKTLDTKRSLLTDCYTSTRSFRLPQVLLRLFLSAVFPSSVRSPLKGAIHL